MAKIHNMISRGQWTTAIKAALGVSKEAGGIERFGETITPMLNLWDLDVPEWSFLRNEHLWAIRRFKAAVAAENGYVGIVNMEPGGVLNDKLIVVTSAAIKAATGDANVGIVTYAALAPREANNILTAARDSRHGATTTARASVGGAAGLLATSAQENIDLSATAYTESLSMPVILHPGFALIFENTVVNELIDGNFAGYVRSALPGELV